MLIDPVRRCDGLRGEIDVLPMDKATEKNCKTVWAKPGDPIYSRGWMIGSAPASKKSWTDMPKKGSAKQAKPEGGEPTRR